MCAQKNDFEDRDSQDNENQTEVENQEDEYAGHESRADRLKNIFRDKNNVIVALIVIVLLAGLTYFFFFKKKDVVNQPLQQQIKFSEEGDIPLMDTKLGTIPEVKIPDLPPAPEVKLMPMPEPVAPVLEPTIKLPEPPRIEPKAIIELPKLPEFKPLPLPEVVREPISSPLEIAPPMIIAGQEVADDWRARKRYAMITAGAGPSVESEKDIEKENKRQVLSLINGKTKTMKSSFASIKESYVGMKDRMILAGKVIDIVLETRINTEQEGTIRAIVSSDVYAEAGFNVLIPAGSRVIGKYSNESKANQVRVNVLLDRIVRPDGVDIMMAGMKGIDRLGGSGFRADKVNTGFGKAVAGSILIGALSLAGLFATRQIDAITGIDIPPPNVDASNNGNSGLLAALIAGGGAVQGTTGDSLIEYGSTTQDILDNITDNLKKRVENNDQKTPIMIVNQGRRVSIMIDKDIIFNDENAFVFYPGELKDIIGND